METDMKAVIKAFQEQIYQRSFASISDQQNRTVFDRPAKGPMWLSRTTFPKPNDDSNVAKVLEQAIKAIGRGDEQYTEPWTPLKSVRGEWIGPRDLSKYPLSTTPSSEKECYCALTNEVENNITILYLHGGAFYFGSPAATRPATLALASMTGGRCFSVQYRLSPQNAFPAAILDAFLAYLTLLYPTSEMYHEPISPECIVFSGDSSGGNIAIAVLQIIRYLHTSQGLSDKLRFNGKDVEVPYPAGCSVLGLLGDNTHCLPSYTVNAKNDVLVDPQPLLQDHFPSCSAWPTTPPRGDVYCEISAMCHPLISPVAAREWTGIPPLWFASGQEQMVDDSAMVAQHAVRQGVKVQWTEYRGMPHLFAFKFPSFPQSFHTFQSWANFIRACVLDRSRIESRAVRVYENELREQTLDSTHLLHIEWDELDGMMREKQRARKVWAGTKRERGSML